MKHATLIAAAVLVLVANAFALLHAARNRSGAADAEIVLADRELHYYKDSDDSGVSLKMTWVDMFRYTSQDADIAPLFDRTKLIELGFDCSVPAGDKNAYSFYQKQPARAVFVALEYDGASFQSWLERERRTPSVTLDRNASRLVIVDAALDSAVLRVRHPDRNRILIAPAVVRVSVLGPWKPGKSAYLAGFVQEIPSDIHVSRPFSDRFREPGRTFYRDDKREEPLYRVRLRYGSQLEPWVTDVEFLK